MPRCFLAIDIPPDVSSRIDSFAAMVRESGVRASFVSPRNLHLTLSFLGEISLQRIEDIRQRFTSFSFPSFTAHAKGVGFFPSAQRPRVMWVGVQALPLASLHEQAMYALGEKNVDPFKAHVTIARLKERASPSVLHIAEKYRAHSFGSFEVRSISLKESVHSPSGAQNSKLYSNPIDAPDARVHTRG